MRLEERFCSLELAKKLKELGVRQESAFYWVAHPERKFEQVELLESRFKGLRSDYDYISAFTVAELGEMFPNVGCLCETHRLLDEWVCCYSTERSEGFLQVEQSLYADTEANARAKMLIYLIEHGIIKAEGIL